MKYVLFVALLFPASAVADTPPIDAALSAGASSFGALARGHLRWRLGATALGADVFVRRGEWFPDGLPTSDVTTFDARASVQRVAFRGGVVALELSGAAGIRALGGSADGGLGFAAELAAHAVVTTRQGLRLRTGLALPFALIGGEVDELAQRLRWGVDVEIARDMWLTGELYAGGSYGYNGDGAKFDAGATLGVRYARLDTPASRSRGHVGAFVATEWRALAIGGHTSHGPGFAVGAILLDGHLKLGIAGFNRPGPINSKTFDTTPVDGQRWNGRSAVPLRSDGNFVGVHVAPSLSIGRVHIELPLTFGQAAFGFYLAGEDRDAVTGERVSDVEDRLFAGDDSSFALGAEAGIKVAVTATSWLRPYAAAHYMLTSGYDTLVRDDYAGSSVAVGVELVAR